MSRRVENLVLGGGLTGLILGRLLGADTVILEANPVPGGLCRSHSCAGFTYDIGGHIIFSRNRDLLEEMLGWLGDDRRRGQRRNQVWYREKFVKYPFENGIFALDPPERLEMLLSYLGRDSTPAANLEEWFRSRFGDALSEKYLLPYNRKIWKRDPASLSLRWVERVPDPPLEDIARAAVGIETEGYTHQLNFFYPRSGGIQALTDSLAVSLPRLHTGCPVLAVSGGEGNWKVETAEGAWEARRLFSTIPVFELFPLLERVPAKVQAALEGLSYNSLITVMLGVRGESLTGKTAIYIPDEGILPHRVCYLKEFSPVNVPPDCSGLVAEITAPPGDPLLEQADESLIEAVTSQLSGICGFSAAKVVAAEVRRFRYAYVVYDLDYDENRGRVYDFLEQLGIRTAGRFGSFRYLNMDACLENARAVCRGEEGKK